MKPSIFLAATLAAAFPATVLAQALQSAPAQATASSTPFAQAEAEAVIGTLATRLEEDFVLPAAGKAYAAMLRAKLASGAYSEFADADEFAKVVTADLQAVHPDGHLSLKAPRAGQGGKRRMAPMPDPATAVGKSGWIADGVAYIAFESFPGDDATLAKIKAFMDSHSSAKTLIIDARGHHGGGIAEMDVMFPYFFAEPVELVEMDTRVAVEQREGDPFEGWTTVSKISSPEGVVRRSHRVTPNSEATALRTAKIYLLTSKRTASAAEHLALALKRTHRATLIGDTTSGAGNYGSPVALGYGYSAFIGVGRTFDPDTGEGWEGTGVAPDIAVPADQALDEALRLAGVGVAGGAALAALK